MNIKIFQSGVELAVKTWVFPDGSIGVRLDTENFTYRTMRKAYQTIVARIQSANDIMQLVMITDALRRFNPTPIRLVLPCLPYARQDRACVEGESFSLKAFGNLINSLSFEQVTVLDPHSHVTEAVIDRCRAISQFDIIHKYFDAFRTMMQVGNKILVSPDAGANKKTSELAKYFGHDAFVRADKLRDLATGNIKETIVYADNLAGYTAVILDDLIDGGKTFTELAKVLKAKQAEKVVLYCTHGIFSKGVEVLLDSGIDEIFTTDSFRQDLPTNSRLTVLPVEPFVL